MLCALMVSRLGNFCRTKPTKDFHDISRGQDEHMTHRLFPCSSSVFAERSRRTPIVKIQRLAFVARMKPGAHVQCAEAQCGVYRAAIEGRSRIARQNAQARLALHPGYAKPP